MSKLVIGVTGGIGSGKTAVTDYFSSLGITVVDADQASRVVVEPGRPALVKIAERHGPDILTDEDTLDRRKLRDIVFNNDSERVWLEQLLHPLIRDQIVQELEASSSPYTIMVSPLLVETDQHVLTNRILVVDVPEEVQLERTMSRDGMSKEQTQSIMAKQASRNQRLEKADEVVDNSRSLDHLFQQLDRIHQTYLGLANT
ncbi:dephospho-CoA kinase [Endozoicomonas numazuensis]|uniref:Dephospho-CoA kinase n=1 Tax=Endozoicomonas numazuensis TaxID=1137799 RepID=A0A081NGC0_9GAMM|nr:dephospho-CoA kinase [Endozoicomonas numazuensis]KEQ17493.1 dephospho-CoA kinase [Endozoicomonas numazuensis]